MSTETFLDEHGNPVAGWSDGFDHASLCHHDPKCPGMCRRGYIGCPERHETDTGPAFATADYVHRARQIAYVEGRWHPVRRFLRSLFS